MNDNDTAYLSSEGRYTVFEFNGMKLKIITSTALEYYDSITNLNPEFGCISVMTKYKPFPDLEEEYIDLVPTLEELLIDPKVFLKPLKKVEVRYDNENIGTDC